MLKLEQTQKNAAIIHHDLNGPFLKALPPSEAHT